MKIPRRKGYGQYDVHDNIETQTEPGSRGLVLKNRLGIRRKREMDQMEYEAMSKGGFQWPPAFRVSPNMEYFETEMLRRHTPCRPGPLPQVARHMAEVHAELLLIHPFRDGNGRLARWLASLMALQAGYPTPEFRFQGRGGKQEKTRYLEAVKQSYLQNYSGLTDFFREVVERRVSG